MKNTSILIFNIYCSKIKSQRISYVFSLFLLITINTLATDTIYKSCPYSVNDNNLTVWKGDVYTPITIKGINLGVSVPGTFPSELTPSYEQYYQWFEMIRAAGFNTIRLYTLHYPRFYQALYDYNTTNSQSPLLILHGVWLEEELDGYNADLFYLKEVFTKEIQDNINCIHGNNTIEHRYGKAYGTYETDISPWILGYIIGREVHPHEVLTTNTTYADVTSYTGTHFSISDVNATEAFVVEHLDKLVDYEKTNYATIRPVSFSSWPTLDPISHPSETTTDEDIVGLNLSGIGFSNSSAGVFITYHAYPYYPDFISKQKDYTEYYDYLGQNSYLGYLNDLKQHYPNMPLIIGEFGVPSSWGIAHYAQSGMNHGGFNEQEQGENNLRMLGSIIDANCGGGLMFAWIDEWFKRTWVTDQMDFLMNRRILWQNITAAEQNFGLIGYNKTDTGYIPLMPECTNCLIQKIDVDQDFRYFKTRITLNEEFGLDDTLWVAVDTYDSTLGESVLPNGKKVKNRAEFALMITDYKSELYITEAYDLFGIWHNISGSEQLFRSTASDGAPWKLVRWKNNEPENEVQYIGSMQVNRLNLPTSSLDAVQINKNTLEIRLPWTLLNFVDPSTLKVMNDDRATNGRELTESDGIALTLFYKDEKTAPDARYVWPTWNHALNTEAYPKSSYHVIKNKLPNYTGALVANNDSFSVQTSGSITVTEENNLYANDKNFDGGIAYVSLTKNPKNGLLQLAENGDFSYFPNDLFAGTDTFSYRLFSNANISEMAHVAMHVSGKPESKAGFITALPNPSTGKFTFTAQSTIDLIEIYNAKGVKIKTRTVGRNEIIIDLSDKATGIYFAKIHSNRDVILKRLVIVP